MEKVLYFVPSLERSGPTNQLYELASNIDPERFAPTFVTLSPGNPEKEDPRFTRQGWDVHVLGMSLKQYFVSGKHRFRMVVDKIAPSIIHTSGVRCDYLVSRLPECRDMFCMTIHCSQAEDSYGCAAGAVLMAMERSAIRKCAFPIACSESLASYYRQHYGLPVKCVQNGVDVDGSPSTQMLDGPIRAAMIGSLCKRKDPLTVISAFGGIGREKIVLEVYGKGELMERCEDVASEAVALLGYKSDIPERLKRIDVLISASQSEGFPMAILEAGAAGCYLILSDIPPHREILHEQDSFGKLFPLGDSASLSTLLQELNSNSLRASRESRRSVFSKEHSSARMAVEYGAIYEKMLSKRGAVDG